MAIASPPRGLFDRIFNLSSELRHRIWEYALHYDVLHINNSNPERRMAQPGLCRVNRQLRAETLPVFYKTNTFTVILDMTGVSLKWLDTIGKDNMNCLRSVLLEHCMDSDSGTDWDNAPLLQMVCINARLDLIKGDFKLEAFWYNVEHGGDWLPIDEDDVLPSKVALAEIFTKEGIQIVRKDARGLYRLMEAFIEICKVRSAVPWAYTHYELPQAT